PRDLIRDIAHHITNDPQRFLTDDVLKRRMMNIGERKMMAVGLIHHGPTHITEMRFDQTVLTYITGHTQAMWLYLLAECVYHPGVLHCLFDAVNRVQPLQKAPVPCTEIPESNSYGCLLKTAVDPIFRAMAEFDARCEFMTTPQLVGQHHFQTRMHELLPGMLDELDSFFLELRAYLWLRSLTDRNTTPALNILSRMLWHHSHKDKGLEPFIMMFRSFLASHCREPSLKLTRGEVQELLLAFIHFLMEVLGRQVHGDMYALAYEATEHWIVP
ncbi:MAG: hypothetical protein GY820_11575, partial [Gammaproteobacteria bacterium]|nr:hypothetical protein [Gammaproteobacteria bacterium]